MPVKTCCASAWAASRACRPGAPYLHAAALLGRLSFPLATVLSGAVCRCKEIKRATADAVGSGRGVQTALAQALCVHVPGRAAQAVGDDAVEQGHGGAADAFRARQDGQRARPGRRHEGAHAQRRAGAAGGMPALRVTVASLLCGFYCRGRHGGMAVARGHRHGLRRGAGRNQGGCASEPEAGRGRMQRDRHHQEQDQPGFEESEHRRAVYHGHQCVLPAGRERFSRLRAGTSRHTWRGRRGAAVAAWFRRARDSARRRH